MIEFAVIHVLRVMGRISLSPSIENTFRIVAPIELVLYTAYIFLPGLEVNPVRIVIIILMIVTFSVTASYFGYHHIQFKKRQALEKSGEITPLKA